MKTLALDFEKQLIRKNDSRYVWGSFDEARSYCQSLRLENKLAWTSFCASGKKPNYIPSHPEKAYAEEWKGFRDWLGNGFMDFKDARKFVRSLKIGKSREWKSYCRSGKKPSDIPSNPVTVYSSSWKGWKDWMGF